MHATRPTGSCPSCGRYVGPHGNEACPHCGARLTERITIRTVKIVATLLASVGLAVLWFAATRAEVPLIRIAQIGATMNMASVRVAGTCTRAPTYDPTSGYLSFWIDDGTGEVRVSAYRAETERIVAEGRVPAPGDAVEVAGTLRVREDLPALTINLPGQLRITRAEPVDRQAGEIAPADQHRRVRVRGQVREVREPYPGLTLITIRDASGAIPIAVSDDLVALSGVSPTLSSIISVGQPVEVVAAVSLYKDTVQLVPATIEDIAPLGRAVPVAAERRIGELGSGDAGTWAMVRGNVTRCDPFSAGVKVTVDDGSGEVIVLLWQSVADALPDRAALDVGAQVQAQGELSLYRGTLELIPELAEDVQVVLAAAPPPTPAPSPTATPSPPPADTPPPATAATPPRATASPADTPAPTATLALTNTPGPAVTPALERTPEETPEPAVDLTEIGAITADWAGQRVTVEGRVIGTASLSAGFKFILDDGTGQIVLLTWHDVYDECWDAAEINLGATVRASGEVSQYEGELQIQPGFGGDVKAIEGATAWSAQREMGSISSADEGQRVTVEGTVVRVEGTSSAVKVFVSDGSGEIMVFIWRNVLDRIANNTGLGTVGSRVRAAGTVTVYRGALEVVPALPCDVAVLEMGK
jgi:DNA/RNA endonuclease YhcR with UshA esterase domain